MRRGMSQKMNPMMRRIRVLRIEGSRRIESLKWNQRVIPLTETNVLENHLKSSRWLSIANAFRENLPENLNNQTWRLNEASRMKYWRTNNADTSVNWTESTSYNNAKNWCSSNNKCSKRKSHWCKTPTTTDLSSASTTGPAATTSTARIDWTAHKPYTARKHQPLRTASNSTKSQ